MNIHKQVATTALLLMLFAVVGAALVGFIYDNTYETIKYNEQQALLKQLNNIVPASAYDNDLLTDTIELTADYNLGTSEVSTAYRARKQGKNVAVVFSAIAPNGYNGSIHLLVGVYNDGNLAGVRVVKHRETPGLGDPIEIERSDWILGQWWNYLIRIVIPVILGTLFVWSLFDDFSGKGFLLKETGNLNKVGRP